jgi:hypothetical protein
MNRYLEKCAGFVHNLSGVGVTLAKNTANTIGKQFHLATGGGIYDYAQNNMKYTSPEKILKDSNSFAGKRKILEHMKINGIKNPGQYLRNKTNAARITSGLIIGSGVYGSNKLINAIHSSFPPSYSNENTSIQYPQYYQ